jgi:hypothetical protein
MAYAPGNHSLVCWGQYSQFALWTGIEPCACGAGQGNEARYINHCCDPNCYTKVVNVNGKKHVAIFSLRHIKMGEELFYDYMVRSSLPSVPPSAPAYLVDTSD